MKDERIPIYISFFSMIIFLISTSFCYIKISKQVESIDPRATTAVIAFESYIPMKIKASDLLTNDNKEIASSIATLTVSYNSPVENAYAFELLMNTQSDYLKTGGVDGISSQEYTYEIFEDGKVIVKETEISSYKEDSQIKLMTRKIKSSSKKRTYQIIFRLYSNEYDQSHLLGTNLNSNLKVQAIN